MSPTRVLPVIMAGGSGTRLWPLSRAQYPKQFLVLHGNRSLFQQAAARLQALQASDIAVMSGITPNRVDSCAPTITTSLALPVTWRSARDGTAAP